MHHRDRPHSLLDPERLPITHVAFISLGTLEALVMLRDLLVSFDDGSVILQALQPRM